MAETSCAVNTDCPSIATTASNLPSAVPCAAKHSGDTASASSASESGASAIVTLSPQPVPTPLTCQPASAEPPPPTPPPASPQPAALPATQKKSSVRGVNACTSSATGSSESAQQLDSNNNKDKRNSGPVGRPSKRSQQQQQSTLPAAPTPEESPVPAHIAKRTDIVFRIGEKLEACDSTGTWYPAKIVALDVPARSVLIHFIRWSTRFDQWMEMSSDQLRALPPPCSANEGKPFVVGDVVLAVWTDNKKYLARIESVAADGSYSILFYDGYRKRVRKNLVEQLPPDYDRSLVDAMLAGLAAKKGTLPAAASTTTMTINADQVASPDVGSSTQSPSVSGTTAVIPSTPIRGKGKRNSLIPPLVSGAPFTPVATKEFVVEVDHNQYKCTITGCNKGFRKETLLNSHIKHYHPEHATLYFQSANSSPAGSCGESNTPTPTRADTTPNSRKKGQLSKQSSMEERAGNAGQWDAVKGEQSNGFSRGKNAKCKDTEQDAQKEPSNDTKKAKRRKPPGAKQASHTKAATESNSRLSSPRNMDDRLPAASHNTLPSPITSAKRSSLAPSVGELSDSTIEEAPFTGSDSKKVARKKRLSSTRRNSQRAGFNELEAPFDFEDDCFEGNDETRSNSPRKKKRPLRNDTINKHLLNLKIDLQERRDRNPVEYPDECSNTPSTSSASESALAETADFCETFHHDYEEKRFRDYPSMFGGDALSSSPLNRKKKRSGNSFNNNPLGLARAKGKPDYSNSGSPLMANPLAITFKRQPGAGLRAEPLWPSGTDPSASCMSPLGSQAEKPVHVAELPFWDARIVKDIHESDDVDELVHCICDFKEESGLMIQCEVCLTWQHGLCFDIEVEEAVPECYVCFACREPRMGRESQKYIYDQEWLGKGKLPSLFADAKPEDIEKQQPETHRKRMFFTNKLLSILLEIAQTLKSLRLKINMLNENRIEEIRLWQEHVPKEELLPVENNGALDVGEELKNKIKSIDEVPNGDNEMLGDILSLSKNILDHMPSDPLDVLKPNDDIDETTDLIDFITSAGKEETEKESMASVIKKELIDMDDLVSERTEGDHCLDRDAQVKRECLRPPDEQILEHICSVQNDVLIKLGFVEKKVQDLEAEEGFDKVSEADLQEDLKFFKDTIKGMYKDLDLVKELADKHTSKNLL